MTYALTRRRSALLLPAALAVRRAVAQPKLQTFTMTHAGDAMHNFPIYVARAPASSPMRDSRSIGSTSTPAPGKPPP